MKLVGETVDGIQLRAGDVAYPLARSLPMGLAWSLCGYASRWESPCVNEEVC